MAYPFTVTLNLDILSDCHIQASTTLAEADLQVEIEKYHQEVEISGIDTEEQLQALKRKLKSKLADYNLTEHQDHFIYFYYLFLNFDAPDFLYNEMLYKHASENVKRLIELVKLRSQKTKDIIISLKSKREAISVTFDTEFVIGQVWDDLHSSLVHASTAGAGNHILREHLKGIELTVDNLKEVANQLRIRKDSFWNRSLADLSDKLLYYLNTNNLYRGETKLSSQQARIIFDLLEVFNLLNFDKISSQKDDYIKALFKNNNLL